jgi:hypothetical protein
MAVSSTDTYSGPYEANGVTVDFPFTFKAVSIDDVAVMIRTADGDQIVDPSAYDVTLAGEGGTASFAVAPTDGEVYVLSEPSFLQPVVFASGQPFLPSVINEVNDRSAARDLVLARNIGRSIKTPLGEDAGTLPRAADRAGKYLAFDAYGDLIVVDGYVPPIDFYALIASEPIDAGDFVNIHQVGGEARIRRALASDPEREAHGFITLPAVSGLPAPFLFAGLNSYQIPAGFSTRMYLSATQAGKATAVAPSAEGSFVQLLGVGLPGMGIRFDRRDAIFL